MPRKKSQKQEIPTLDWRSIAANILTSRTMDDIEETELRPQKKVLYQFSARGHELAQSILGILMTHPKDGISAYYRCRPLFLMMGMTPEQAFSSAMAREGSVSGGRDIGVVANLPSRGGATILPMAGDVGSQYTPGVGWAQAQVYRRDVLKEKDYAGAITVIYGGDGSVATNGFWSSLTIATTLRLPVLYIIEDNSWAISVRGHLQTPGGNIAENLKSFANLTVIDGSGTDPEETARLVGDAVALVRRGEGPAFLRLTVPRLSGHSGQDNSAYKSPEDVEREKENDPLDKLHSWLVPGRMSATEWKGLVKETERAVRLAADAALAQPEPDPARAHRYLYTEKNAAGQPEIQLVGGLAAEGIALPPTSDIPQPDGPRVNTVEAIRRALAHELEVNPRVLIFGEDVGPKGGVHTATLGLTQKFGEERVFDTSLSEEGIIGRAVGMAMAGLVPVPEIQFRKYADPAHEQLNNLGTLRWRTVNRFAAPLVVRMPGGFFKVGDPWHSWCNEVQFAHAPGWWCAYPSNAEDAVGLLRTALRGNEPVMFFEHRQLLDNSWARRPYPGDDFALPFGVAKIIRPGSELTIVTWGAMVQRCEEAIREADVDAEIIDLRTVAPWDREAVLASVRKTRRLLIVHEDGLTAGFGAEIAAVVTDQAFLDLDAPVRRVATPDTPVPYNTGLMDALVPNVERIARAIEEIVEF